MYSIHFKIGVYIEPAEGLSPALIIKTSPLKTGLYINLVLSSSFSLVLALLLTKRSEQCTRSLSSMASSSPLTKLTNKHVSNFKGHVK